MNTGENDRDLAEFSRLLEARRVELRDLSDSARVSRKPVELDQSKVGHHREKEAYPL